MEARAVQGVVGYLFVAFTATAAAAPLSLLPTMLCDNDHYSLFQEKRNLCAHCECN